MQKIKESLIHKVHLKMLVFVMHFRINAYFGLQCMLDGWGSNMMSKGNKGTASMNKAMAETGLREDARRMIYAP